MRFNVLEVFERCRYTGALLFGGSCIDELDEAKRIAQQMVQFLQSWERSVASDLRFGADDDAVSIDEGSVPISYTFTLVVCRARLLEARTFLWGIDLISIFSKICTWR